MERAATPLTARKAPGLQKPLERLIVFGIGFAIVFSTLLHGGIEPWALAAAELAIAGVIFVYGVLRIRDGKSSFEPPVVVWPLAGFFLLGLAQCLAYADAEGRRQSLSFDVDATRTTTLAIFLLTAFLIISSDIFRTADALEKWARFLILFGFLFAVFALIQHFTWNGLYFWFRKPVDDAWALHKTAVFGSFVNHNHFAGYMEMMAPIPVGLAVSRPAGGWRWFYLLAATVMGIAALAALSRGGAIALGLESIFLLYLMSRQGVTVRRMVTITVLAFAIGAGALALYADTIAGRIAETDFTYALFFEVRGWMWRDAFTIFQNHPIVGVGLGAFSTALPMYSLRDGSWNLQQAHNDYLQVLAEAGIVGGVLVLWFLLGTFRQIFRGVRSSNPQLAGLALGAGTGVVGLLTHSFFDFNLRIPSNALLFLTLIGVVSSAGKLASAAEERKEAARQTSATGVARKWARALTFLITR